MMYRILNRLYAFVRNFVRNLPIELVLGIGVFIASMIIIVSYSFTQGLQSFVEETLSDSLRAEIPLAGEVVNSVEAVGGVADILAQGPNVAERRLISQNELDNLTSIPGVSGAIPVAKLNAPVTIQFRIKDFPRPISFSGVIAGIPSEHGHEFLRECSRRPLSEDEYCQGWSQGCSMTECLDSGLGFENGFAAREDGTVPVIGNEFLSVILAQAMQDYGLPPFGADELMGLPLTFVFGQTTGSRAVQEAVGELLTEVPESQHRVVNTVIAGFTNSAAVESLVMPIDNILAFRSAAFNESEPQYDKAILLLDADANSATVGRALRNQFNVLESDVLRQYRAQCREIEDENEQIIRDDGDDSPNIKPLIVVDSETNNTFDCNERYIQIMTELDAKKPKEAIENTTNVVQWVIIGAGFIILALSLAAVIYAFLYLVIRRIREIGLARFYGSTRAGVVLSITLEAALVGFITSLLGLLVAPLVVTGMINGIGDLIASIGNEAGPASVTILGFVDKFRGIEIDTTIGWYVVLGCTIASFLAAFVPTTVQVFKNIDKAIR